MAVRLYWGCSWGGWGGTCTLGSHSRKGNKNEIICAGNLKAICVSINMYIFKPFDFCKFLDLEAFQGFNPVSVGVRIQRGRNETVFRTRTNGTNGNFSPSDGLGCFTKDSVTVRITWCLGGFGKRTPDIRMCNSVTHPLITPPGCN